MQFPSNISLFHLILISIQFPSDMEKIPIHRCTPTLYHLDPILEGKWEKYYIGKLFGKFKVHYKYNIVIIILL